MNRIHSHIKSKEHFDAIWNDTLDLYSKYFSNNLSNVFAYTFKLKGFLTFLYQNVDFNSEFQDNETNALLSSGDALLQHANVDRFTPQLHTAFNNYLYGLCAYEKRKKNIKSEKISSFFLENYSNMTKEQKSLVVLPFDINVLSEDFFSDFYPSIRTNIISFLLDKGLVNYNPNYEVIFLKKHNITNEEIESINLAGSLSQVSHNLKQVSDLTSKLSQLVDNLSKDREYLEVRLVELQDFIEKQNKEGMNGYLLTWH